MSLSSVSNSTILIVDDMPDYLELLSTELKRHSFQVVLAQDGLAAIEQAKAYQPDIILLDVVMPEVDGFETCRQLKAGERTKDIPIIFMTAVTDIESKVKAFELGGIDYITKPIDDREVIARVTTHLSLRQLQRQLEAEVLERRGAEGELRQYANKLQARNAELDAFSRTVAHNLKDPLSVIKLGAEIMKADYGRLSIEDMKGDLAMLAQNAEKACHIVDELLILATVHKDEVKTEPLDMKRIVQEASQRLSKIIREKQAEIILPGEWPLAQGYAPWVEEIWFNYLSNALKYGGEPPRVALGADRRNDGMISFWVKDNGIGITPKEQSKLFTPFTRIHKASAQGEGLGLSIVRHIVEKLGGRVNVQSDGVFGHGSLFSFTLPAVS